MDLKKNWKTTLGGIIGAIAVGLASSPEPVMHFIGLGLGMVASTWFGYHAEDKKP